MFVRIYGIKHIFPVPPYEIASLDDVKSFKMKIVYAEILIETPVLEQMFNKKIMNYENSPLRNQKV